jgi:alkanesulfonate monooxygenase SsuD/methylene tetrahydromethanopterin reductase-like flavin-dependent oxidoreductase (luciferase family)
MWTYLVGSYGTVAAELARYVARCRQTFILDVPFDREELDHVNIAFERAIAHVET